MSFADAFCDSSRSSSHMIAGRGTTTTSSSSGGSSSGVKVRSTATAPNTKTITAISRTTNIKIVHNKHNRADDHQQHMGVGVGHNNIKGQAHVQADHHDVTHDDNRDADADNHDDDHNYHDDDHNYHDDNKEEEEEEGQEEDDDNDSNDNDNGCVLAGPMLFDVSDMDDSQATNEALRRKLVVANAMATKYKLEMKVAQRRAEATKQVAVSRDEENEELITDMQQIFEACKQARADIVVLQNQNLKLKALRQKNLKDFERSELIFKGQTHLQEERIKDMEESLALLGNDEMQHQIEEQNIVIYDLRAQLQQSQGFTRDHQHSLEQSHKHNADARKTNMNSLENMKMQVRQKQKVEEDLEDQMRDIQYQLKDSQLHVEKLTEENEMQYETLRRYKKRFQQCSHCRCRSDDKRDERKHRDNNTHVNAVKVNDTNTNTTTTNTNMTTDGQEVEAEAERGLLLEDDNDNENENENEINAAEEEEEYSVTSHSSKSSYYGASDDEDEHEHEKIDIMNDMDDMESDMEDSGLLRSFNDILLDNNSDNYDDDSYDDDDDDDEEEYEMSDDGDGDVEEKAQTPTTLALAPVAEEEETEKNKTNNNATDPTTTNIVIPSPPQQPSPETRTRTTTTRMKKSPSSRRRKDKKEKRIINKGEEERTEEIEAHARAHDNNGNGNGNGSSSIAALTTLTLPSSDNLNTIITTSGGTGTSVVSVLGESVVSMQSAATAPPTVMAPHGQISKRGQSRLNYMLTGNTGTGNTGTDEASIKSSSTGDIYSNSHSHRKSHHGSTSTRARPITAKGASASDLDSAASRSSRRRHTTTSSSSSRPRRSKPESQSQSLTTASASTSGTSSSAITTNANTAATATPATTATATSISTVAHHEPPIVGKLTMTLPKLTLRRTYIPTAKTTTTPSTATASAIESGGMECPTSKSRPGGSKPRNGSVSVSGSVTSTRSRSSRRHTTGTTSTTGTGSPKKKKMPRETMTLTLPVPDTLIPRNVLRSEWGSKVFKSSTRSSVT
jgi:hypothetical protein